jgi:hypothetical protein
LTPGYVELVCFGKQAGFIFEESFTGFESINKAIS